MTTWQLVRRAVRMLALAVVVTAAAFGCAVAGFAFVLVRQAARELPAPVAITSDYLVQDRVIVDRNGRRMIAVRRGDAHREVIAYDAMSPHLLRAVVAAEDQRFWTHRGIDPHGIARAFFANVMNGRSMQGGSTITQQLLKLMLLGGRPPLLRKVEEAMLAERFEQLLTKEDLLALYLNAVYLGGGNAGVEAASRDLFGTSAAGLDLAQAALLVGMIPAPSARSPFCAPDLTRTHQRRVLRRMVETGAITLQDADRAARSSVAFRLAGDAPADHEMASAIDACNAATPHANDRRIETTIDVPLQQLTSRALRHHLEEYARRRGEHRGPRVILDPDVRDPWREQLGKFRATLAQWGTGDRELLVYDLRDAQVRATPLPPCRFGSAIFRRAASRGFASGIVVASHGSTATLDLGDLVGTLTAATVVWTGRSLSEVAPVGAVVDVRLPDVLPATRGASVAVELIPRPIVEGAIVILEPTTREVLAVVGGVEPHRGSYNRAVRARRPVGSTVKPFVFAAGIGAGVLTVSSDVHDLSYRYVNPWTGSVWQPENWYPGNDGTLALSEAMARSVNMAAVETMLATGVDRVATLIEEVSPVAPVRHEPAIALGAFERTPLELANAYAVFASGGRLAPPIFVRRAGQPGSAVGEIILDPQLVRAVDWLLTQPVVHPRGTARRLQDLELGLRGKTGTTDQAHDAWFVGYTPELLVAVWVGYDQPASLRGPQREESGGTLAVPIANDVFAAARVLRGLTPATYPDAPTDTTLRIAGPDASSLLRRAFPVESEDPSDDGDEEVAP
ncbi:MAG: transglycosylase domain-containing protein [bacterium]|nr:transglycosylase domain-containing protein [bacterium]